MNFSFLNQSWFLVYPLLIWSLFWKGLALWRSARSGQKYWFIALLVVNTVGVLEIIYLLVAVMAQLELKHFQELLFQVDLHFRLMIFLGGPVLTYI